MIKQMRKAWGSPPVSLIISPPFGNYIRLPGSKSIKGSFTLEPRGGLVPQIIKTLRFSFEYNGWVNKIGLRNKGLKYGIKNYNHETDILSIAIMNESEIKPILNMLPKTANIELNVSCPNVEKELNDTIEMLSSRQSDAASRLKIILARGNSSIEAEMSSRKT